MPGFYTEYPFEATLTCWLSDAYTYFVHFEDELHFMH